MKQSYHGFYYLCVLVMAAVSTAVAEKLVCGSEFLKGELEVTCTTGRIHPKGFCAWEIHRKPVSPVYMSHFSIVKNLNDSKDEATDTVIGSKEFRRICRITHSVTTVGLYNFDVLVYKDKPERNQSLSAPFKSVSYTVRVEFPPQGPPVFTDHQGSPLTSLMEAEENKTFNLTCEVTGGIPPVYETTVSCPDLLVKTQPGQSVTLELNATQDVNNQSCVCTAGHVLGYTRTASLTILVKPSTASPASRNQLHWGFYLGLIMFLIPAFILSYYGGRKFGLMIIENERKKLVAQMQAAMMEQPSNNNIGDPEEPVHPDNNKEYYILFSPNPFTSRDMELLRQIDNMTVLCQENEANGGGHMVLIAAESNGQEDAGNGVNITAEDEANGFFIAYPQQRNSEESPPQENDEALLLAESDKA